MPPRSPVSVQRHIVSHTGYTIREVFSLSDDKTLVCKDCGETFTFTASEQEFYASKGFENEPGRCPSCRAERKQQSRGGYSGQRREDREMFDAVCAECGAATQVPFKPTEGRPVYCRECFKAQRSSRW